MTQLDTRMTWLRRFFYAVAVADLLLGVWLLFWPYHFMAVMQLSSNEEPIFVRESGSYMAFAALLCTLGGYDPRGNVAVCQSTIVYRALACAIEVIAVLWLLPTGVFRCVFSLCAFLDGSLALVTILMMRWVGLPWIPFSRAS